MAPKVPRTPYYAALRGIAAYRGIGAVPVLLVNICSRLFLGILPAGAWALRQGSIGGEAMAERGRKRGPAHQRGRKASVRALD